MAAFPPCEFWDFSLALYAREGVAPACLALQARHGADVNLLLYFCWCAASGRGALKDDGLARAQALIARWHEEVVRGLRLVRMRLGREPNPASPEEAAALRKRIQAVELEAEHIEQLALFGLAPTSRGESIPLATRAADAAESARSYLLTLGAKLDAEDRADLAALLAGCFPELSPGELRQLVEKA